MIRLSENPVAYEAVTGKLLRSALICLDQGDVGAAINILGVIASDDAGRCFRLMKIAPRSRAHMLRAG